MCLTVHCIVYLEIALRTFVTQLIKINQSISIRSADLSGVNYALNHQKCCLQLISVQLTLTH